MSKKKWIGSNFKVSTSSFLPHSLSLSPYLSPRGANLHSTLCTELSMRWSKGWDEFRWMCAVNIAANPIKCTVVRFEFSGNGGRRWRFQIFFLFFDWNTFHGNVRAMRRSSSFPSLFFLFLPKFRLNFGLHWPIDSIRLNVRFRNWMLMRDALVTSKREHRRRRRRRQQWLMTLLNYFVWHRTHMRISLHIVTVGCVASAAHCCMSRRAVRCTHSFSAQIITNQFFRGRIRLARTKPHTPATTATRAKSNKRVEPCREISAKIHKSKLLELLFVHLLCKYLRAHVRKQ